MAKILITGGTGLVGEKLTKMLVDKKHEVAILSRNPQLENEFKWNISEGYIDKKAFTNVDYIIHLAGAGIADKRWSDQRKKIIIDSRVESTKLLLAKVKDLNVSLKGFISASGSGFYGAITSETIFTEEDKAATDFLGTVCKKWEAAAHQFKKLKVPVTILRTGIVLSKKGGALAKMKTPVVSPLGSGKQYMPWIHIEDLCNMYINTIENNITGVFNAVAPQHHTSGSFSKILAKHISRPFLPICVPSFLLKLSFGELAIILLEGSRVSSDKIIANGFLFKFPTLPFALENLMRKRIRN
jgi:uncharacterized protein (TIGR01777 family)